MASLTDELISEAKRIEEDANYSARSHFVAARRWRAVHLWVGVPSVIAATLAGLSALAVFDYHNVVASLLALVAAASTAVMTFLNPHAEASRHLQAGNRYLAIRNRARLFYRIECRNEQNTDSELCEMLKRLARHRDTLNQSSPAIPLAAFIAARRGIEAGESQYVEDSTSAQ